MQQHVKPKPPATLWNTGNTADTTKTGIMAARLVFVGHLLSSLNFSKCLSLPGSLQPSFCVRVCVCVCVWVGGHMDGMGRTSHTLSSPYLMLQVGQLRTGFFLQCHLTQSENCSLVLGTQLFVSQTLLQHCNTEAVEGSGPFCSWLWSLYVPLQRDRPTQSYHY